MLAVDTADYRGEVHVQLDGVPDGRVLVLLHGFASSLQWFDLVTASLNDTFRVVRMDLVGLGATGGPALDAPAQAAVVEGVLDQLDVHDVVVVGHSFGADVAVGVAATSPRVARVVIVAQAPDYSDARLPPGSALMTPQLLGTVLHRIAVPVAVSLGAVASRSRLPQRDLVGQGIADFRATNPGMFRVVIRDRRERLRVNPLDAQLRAIGKPALVILGEKDYFYGARSAQRYRDVGAQVEVLADSGHSAIIDCPGEVADALRGFAG